MAEYIERKTLIAWLENMHGTKNIINAIQNKKRFPSADVVEVKYGEWEYCCTHNNKKYYRCSVCHYSYLIYENTQYCQHCGAKMKVGA